MLVGSALNFHIQANLSSVTMGNELSALDNRSTFDDSVTPRTLAKRTVSAVADYIRSGHVSKVVFMVRFAI